MDDQESDQRKADLDSEDDHICADFASEVNRKRAAKIKINGWYYMTKKSWSIIYSNLQH